MFHTSAFDDHEEVVFTSEPDSGLKAIIAIHNTSRGPALGGCRVWAYDSDDDAIEDVLRLARGMTYKNAIADLPLGGGKAVLLLEKPGTKSPDMFAGLGRAIERLGGRYVTAEDVGTSPQDMLTIREQTRHVAGIPVAHGGLGDPSPATAFGCFQGIRAAIKAALGRSELTGVHVAIQGLGNVGYRLAELLHQAGARLTVTDIKQEALQRAERELGATVVGLDEIYQVEADVFSPNALGASINETTIPQLRVAAVAGAANNQLATEQDGDRLARRGILYAPDYVVNAGGVTKICGDYFNWSSEEIDQRVGRIEQRIADILDRAKSDGVAPHEMADRIAETKFKVR